MTTLGPVTEPHHFDEARLANYLADQGFVDFQRDLKVLQYQGGQSNPTYRLEAGGRYYVLRKKPPGDLLPSAHLVEREYRVMKALYDTDVPVPQVLHLCRDEDVIEQTFFLMEHVNGYVPTGPGLPEVSSCKERGIIYDAMNDALARLHSIDWEAVGLTDYGKPADYVARQVARWTQQYEATKHRSIPAMDALIEWLPSHLPADDETSIAHGDYRLDNMIFQTEKPRVLAIVDWELSTLGHPLADLAYNCMAYHLPEGPLWKGLGAMDCAEFGIPSEEEYVTAYCRRTGRDGVSNWEFFLAFGLFRLASICQGVYARVLEGNASSKNALEVGGKAPMLADAGWKLAQRA